MRGPGSLDEQAARVIDGLSVPEQPYAQALRAAQRLGGGANPFWYYLHTINYLATADAQYLESTKFLQHLLDRIGEAFYAPAEHDSPAELIEDWACTAAILYACASVLGKPQLTIDNTTAPEATRDRIEITIR